MKLDTTADVLDAITAFGASAALNAALELGLFWHLAGQPDTAEGVAQLYGIPLRRCQYWLELLVNMDLLECTNSRYIVSSVTRIAILEAYSKETWAFRAQSRHGWYPAGVDLPSYIRHYGSVWALQDRQPPDEYQRLKSDPAYAARFTRAIYELHLSLAKELADTLDMSGLQRLMDLGGGSGVVSLELLRRYPQLTSVVVDLEHVCAAGREIAAENSLAERITYYPADFLIDELPVGFDLVLECDVGIYELSLFRKIHAALKPGGHFVLVGPFAPREGVPPVGQELLTFLSTLKDPDFHFRGIESQQAILDAAGFEEFAMRALSEGRSLLEVRK